MNITPICAALVSITLSALTACGVSDALPAVAVSSTTAAVVRISTSGLSSESLRQSVDSFAPMLSKSTIPQLAQGAQMLTEQSAEFDPAKNEEMRRLDETMAAMRQINAKAVYILADGTAASTMPETMTALPIEQDGIMILVQTNGTRSQSDIQSLVGRAFNVAVMVESLGQGWYWLKADASQTLPAVPDISGARQLDVALNALAPSAVSVGMRVTAEVREACATALESDESGMAMFLGGFIEPLTKLSSISASIGFGSNPTMCTAMTFETKEAAGEFNSAWASTTRSLFSMVGMMAAGGGKGEKKIDPKTFSAMATALAMVQDEAKLTMTLDDLAWKKLIP